MGKHFYFITALTFFLAGPPTSGASAKTKNLGGDWEGGVLKSIKTDARNRPLRVFIDPGHGGRDNGAQGFSQISEKILCLKLAREVRLRLQQAQKTKVEIRLSREADAYLSLRERVAKANNWGADLFLSIHANSSPVAKVRGFEVYFLSSEASDDAATTLAQLENKENRGEPKTNSDIQSILSDIQTNNHVNESARFAEAIFTGMSRKIRANSHGVRQAPFTVLAGTTMPAVLLEVGYVTNREEASWLSTEDYLKRLADAISSSVVAFALERKKASSKVS